MPMTTRNETCVDDLLDRADWTLLVRQKSSLLAAMVYAEQLKRPHTLKDLQALYDWLDDLGDAAKSDGHPVVRA
jgi:hypothetical protein